MNDLENTNKVKTMSSREIAGITGKEHKNVIRDIEKMFNQLKIELVKFQGLYEDQKGEMRKCYHLPRRECLILVSGYDTVLRAKIIDRWEALETGTAQPRFKPQKPKVFITGVLLKELRLLTDNHGNLMRKAGIDENQILIASSRVMESVLGVNPANTLDIPTPNNSQYYTATALGERLEGKPSGREVNKKLVQLGFLLFEHEPSGKRRNILTLKGKEAGGRVFDSGKKHSDGSIVQSIKWQDNILDILKGTNHA
ncbi:Anti-repressor protein [Candidatus Liberibacter solanacearum]|uniref:Anti-repressor protein n=2 Tax=Candidatus Liberibacter solanacearum TaxID=556287 RepID=A0A0F4VJN6_9HYPH|nr:Rha family transcriptional regulator [Candidatus Liberibacter solanacearum]KJZ81604.1 Anti-repressor protein [Candidatus Liberibacter solanacearum]